MDARDRWFNTAAGYFWARSQHLRLPASAEDARNQLHAKYAETVMHDPASVHVSVLDTGKAGGEPQAVLTYHAANWHGHGVTLTIHNVGRAFCARMRVRRNYDHHEAMVLSTDRYLVMGETVDAVLDAAFMLYTQFWAEDASKMWAPSHQFPITYKTA